MDIFVNCSKTNSRRGLKKFRHMYFIKVHPYEQFGIDPDHDPDLRNIFSLCLIWGFMRENSLNAYNLKTVADRDIVTVIH